MTKDKKLISAIKLVKEAIMVETRRLEKIASSNEQGPILIEGETHADYYCQLMVDPSVVAKIMLRYDYPTCRVLEHEASDDMWEELGREFGLKTVCSVDL